MKTSMFNMFSDISVHPISDNPTVFWAKIRLHRDASCVQVISVGTSTLYMVHDSSALPKGTGMEVRSALL